MENKLNITQILAKMPCKCNQSKIMISFVCLEEYCEQNRFFGFDCQLKHQHHNLWKLSDLEYLSQFFKENDMNNDKLIHIILQELEGMGISDNNQQKLNQIFREICKRKSTRELIYFDENLKSKQIILNYSNSVDIMKSNGQWHFAIINPSIEQFDILYFQIKCSYGGFIGVGHIDSIKQHNFQYKSTCQCDMISNTGCRIQQDKSMKGKMKPFSFGNGDTILCIWDKMKCQLVLYNSNNYKTYQIDVMINGDPLHMCVLMYGVEEEFQIFSY